MLVDRHSFKVSPLGPAPAVGLSPWAELGWGCIWSSGAVERWLQLQSSPVTLPTPSMHCGVPAGRYKSVPFPVQTSSIEPETVGTVSP